MLDPDGLFAHHGFTKRPIQSCGGRGLKNSSRSSCLWILAGIFEGTLRRRRRFFSALPKLIIGVKPGRELLNAFLRCNVSSRCTRLKCFCSDLFYLPCRVIASAVIGKRFAVRPPPRKTIHLPRLAQQTAGSLILWTFTLVMSHKGFEFVLSQKNFSHGFSATTLPSFQM